MKRIYGLNQAQLILASIKNNSNCQIHVPQKKNRETICFAFFVKETIFFSLSNKVGFNFLHHNIITQNFTISTKRSQTLFNSRCKITNRSQDRIG